MVKESLKFEKYLQQGYHVVQVNGYTVNGKDYYAAIWDKSPVGPWASRHGMSSDGMQKVFDAYLEEGYRMTHVSGYEVEHEARFAAVWEKGDNKLKAARTKLTFRSLTVGCSHPPLISSPASHGCASRCLRLCHQLLAG